MPFQSFRKIKISLEDKLFSEIIRWGKTRCTRCDYHRPLQTAHIMGRGHMATRWQIEPVANAIAICGPCHENFDKSKDDTPLFDIEARKYFTPEKNAYAFLVAECGYTWDDLLNLYVLSHRKTTKMGLFERMEVRRQLKAELKRLENKNVT